MIKAPYPIGVLMDGMEVFGEDLVLGRVLEFLCVDPLDVQFGPIAPWPTLVVTQEKFAELVASAQLSGFCIAASANEIPHGLAGFVRYTNLNEVTGAQEMGQAQSVLAVGLHPIPAAPGDFGRRDHNAVDIGFGEGALQTVAGGSSFVGAAQRFSGAQAIQGLQKPTEVIGISGDVTRFAAAFFGYSNGDGISVDVGGRRNG